MWSQSQSRAFYSGFRICKGLYVIETHENRLDIVFIILSFITVHAIKRRSHAIGFLEDSFIYMMELQSVNKHEMDETMDDEVRNDCGTRPGSTCIDASWTICA